MIEARGLGWAHPDTPDRPVLAGLTFTIGPGLTLVRGGEGRGKTTLLRLLAGDLAPGAGALVRRPGRALRPSPADPACDPQRARDWLLDQDLPALQADPAAADPLLAALGLVEHIDKPMFMLSTGSRRKVGLLAAALAGAPLTLLDQPFAALDARSCRVVAELLADAAASSTRAWVIADHGRSHWLDDIALAGVIDLGD
ncbi:ABC transporter ATP-binding protein [Leptothrix discophora]|uniref:ATP-binding cassette domain-containing protein n=1 Tax=Leptothrix discophora TaxID=89 RepID=A0ABT9G204_LEPDI|nr:ATP-binding cassette domain-containing protein [Leptothrix discophora]MDP4300198.1 ATP-binding cassette domain-containing protein [Leptothrix discophora]